MSQPLVFAALMGLGRLSGDRRVAAVERRLAGRRLAYALLVAVSGTTGWTIESEMDGRPRARHPGSTCVWDLSIAHSGAVVAAAVCDRGAVGVDVEWHEPGRDHRGIARLTFGPKEQELAERGGFRSFYRLWTVREAISKATGVGLAMVMDGVDRLPAEPHSGHWLSSDRQWLLTHFEPRPDLSLALAVRKAVPFDSVPRSPVCLRWFSEDEVDTCLRPPERAPAWHRERQTGASV